VLHTSVAKIGVFVRHQKRKVPESLVYDSHMVVSKLLFIDDHTLQWDLWAT